VPDVLVLDQQFHPRRERIGGRRANHLTRGLPKT
jgi:hypothetical protein